MSNVGFVDSFACLIGVQFSGVEEGFSKPLVALIGVSDLVDLWEAEETADRAA